MNSPPANHGTLIKAAGKLLLIVLSGRDREKSIAKYKGRLRKHMGTRYVADLYGMDLTLTRVIKYRQEWFQEPRWVEFEGRKMPIPTGAEGFLSERYGSDFMKIPPEEKRQSYHRYAYVSFDQEYHEA